MKDYATNEDTLIAIGVAIGFIMIVGVTFKLIDGLNAIFKKRRRYRWDDLSEEEFEEKMDQFKKDNTEL